MTWPCSKDASEHISPSCWASRYRQPKMVRRTCCCLWKGNYTWEHWCFQAENHDRVGGVCASWRWLHLALSSLCLWSGWNYSFVYMIAETIHSIYLGHVYLSWDTSLLVKSKFLLHKPLSFRKTYCNQGLEVKEELSLTISCHTAAAPHPHCAEGTEIWILQIIQVNLLSFIVLFWQTTFCDLGNHVLNCR